MNKSMRYELNCGQYVLHQNGKPVHRVHDEVAICLDKESGTRHKFGDPEVVRAWHANTQKSFRDAGSPEMAEDLVVIQGRFTLEDINKVIDNSCYTAVLYTKVMDGTAEVLDLHGNVVRPGISTLCGDTAGQDPG
jgi:hypothetical protein